MLFGLFVATLRALLDGVLRALLDGALRALLDVAQDLINGILLVGDMLAVRRHTS